MKTYSWKYVTFVTLITLVSVTLPAHAGTAGASPTTGRLAAVARLWGAVRYFDPWVVGRQDNAWDSALVDALPHIEAARTAAEYSAAVQQMLASLHDSATYVESTTKPSERAGGPAFNQKVENGIANLSLGDLPALAHDYPMGVDAAVAAFVKSALSAEGIVFDLRASQPLTDDESGGVDAALQATTLLPLVHGNLPSLNSASPFYLGFPANTFESTGGYYQGFETQPGAALSGGATSSTPISVIVNANSEVPPVLLALIRAGRIHVISEGPPPAVTAPSTAALPVGDGLVANVRQAEYNPDFDLTELNFTSVKVDATHPAAALEKAIALLGTPLLVSVTPPHDPSAPPQMTGPPKEDSGLPSEPYRLLAAFKIYNVIRYFYPYSPLMHEDWDAALQQAIPEFHNASSPYTYLLAVSKFYAHIHDSHGFMLGPLAQQYFGTGPPVLVRYLHGAPVITDFLSKNDARRAGAQIGDVIVDVDGRPIPLVIARWTPYIAASTPQAMMRQLFGFYGPGALTGEEGSVLSLRVRTPSGAMRTLHFVRSNKHDNFRPRLAYRVLPGNVGYVSLTWLAPDQVDRMFTALRNTTAIVFDDRGYPDGTLWAIAPRLTRATNVKAALIDTPLARYMVQQEGDLEWVPTMRSFYTLLPPASSTWRYVKPTVTLIDERTLSQAEYTAMYLRAADHSTFVGTPTMGADGDVTNFTAPGGVDLCFTGQGVRWPDGRQTQRIGMLPDIRVEPTAKDIARGDDVVLQAGLHEALRRAGSSEKTILQAVSQERAAEVRAFLAAK